MKKLLKYFAAAGVVSMSLVACVDEDPKIDPVPPVEQTGTGFLTLGGSFVLTVESRNEEINNTPGAVTRAENGNTDVATYTVEILDAKGQAAVEPFLYGDMPTEAIELPVGAYTLNVYSAQTPDTAWEGEAYAPTYGAQQTFTITKGATTDLGTVTCHPLSVKVTVAYRESLYELLSADTEADVELGGASSLVFAKDEARAGYLRPTHTGDEPNELWLYLTTVYEGKQITRQPLKVTNNAKAGEWRKITIYLENGENGSVIINGEIETWVNGETVDIDVQTLATISEATIPDDNDPDAPRIVWSATDEPVGEPVLLTEDSYDENGYYTGDARVTIHATDPMTRFLLEVTTDNAAVQAILEENELASEVDLFTVDGKARSRLRLWGFPVVNLGVTERTFDLAPLVKVIFDYEGKHTFRMTVTDGKNRRSTTELTFEVDKSGGDDPNIRWIGNDIDVRHEAYAGLPVVIRIKAKEGIRSLQVAISGTLASDPTELSGLGLADSFDLVDPEATREGLGTALQGLGFPVGDDVRDKPEISFDITTFMGLLGSFPGNNDFKLTVTDNTGQTCVKTLMLYVPEE